MFALLLDICRSSAPWDCCSDRVSGAAHLLVAKYCDHLPLYRQSGICAREGLELDRSTLCDWVGQAA
jgi:transposase